MEKWILIILIIALYVVVNSYISNCFYQIACEKGFDDRRYFWMPFWFSLIGYLLVVALPDRKQERRPVAKPLVTPTPVVTSTPVGKWVCPECGNTLPGDVIRCKCGYARSSGKP